MALGNKKTARGRIRSIVQIAFFLLIALIAVNHGLEEAGFGGIPIIGSGSTHAVCPFGGVVTLAKLFTEGSFVSKVHESAIVLMVAAFFSTLLFGPAFCGWVCPFGSFQELLGKAGKKISGKQFNRIVPERVDKILRYLRYLVLAWVLYITFVTGKLIFAGYDPYYALFNFWSGEVAIGALVILGIVVLLSLIIERPFCKYACPYGALLGLFNLFRIFGIKRKSSSCIDCKDCDRACPMNITVSSAGRVRDHQCISCMKCSSEEACPVDATVFMGTGKADSDKGEGVA
jgi:polyferredoxin